MFTCVYVYIRVAKMELVLPSLGIALSVVYFYADSLITNGGGGGTAADSLSTTIVGM